jgi:alpha-L-rhamnosidase
MLRIAILAALSAILANGLTSSSALTVRNLRIGFLSRPTGVQDPTPLFSWELHSSIRGDRQTAYQLVVSVRAPGVNSTVVWNTGKVMSNQTLALKYAGATALLSDTDYDWTLSAWDNHDQHSVESQSTFSTALLSADDWVGSEWIGGLNQTDDRNQFRYEFSLPRADAILRARCYVSGLGYEISHVNGEQLGDQDTILGPAVQFESRVPYQSHDCTAAMQAGGETNVWATTLGRGWYSLPEDQFTAKLGYKTIGTRSMRVLITAHLKVGDEVQLVRVGSSTNWKHSSGMVTFDHLFLGEVHDGRKDTTGWYALTLAHTPALIHTHTHTCTHTYSHMQLHSYILTHAAAPALLQVQTRLRRHCLGECNCR